MKYKSQGMQLTIDAFKSSLEGLSKANRWVKLGDTLPWGEIERLYAVRLNNGKRGAGNKPARMIIGALIIKHKMNLSDEETILAIQENPYMQYFVGLSEFTDQPIFDSSLFVAIRKRLGTTDFNDMSVSLLELQFQLEKSRPGDKKSNSQDEGGGQGDLNDTQLFYSLKRYEQRTVKAIITMFHQQDDMFKSGVKSCADCIISIFQPGETYRTLPAVLWISSGKNLCG